MSWRVRLSWRPFSLRRESGLSYQVACSCGAKLSGERRPMHQILSCPKCECPVFVFPRSQWDQNPTSAIAVHKSAQHAFRARDWLLAVAAVLITLGILVLAYLWFFGDSSRSDRVLIQYAETNPNSALLARHARAEKLLAEGYFRLAVEELSSGEKLNLASLTTPERLRWDQTQKQAALLADLVAEPLEEILIHAAGTREPEWSAEFEKRYKGKSVVFDAEWQRGPDGGGKIRYPLLAGRDRARLAMEGLAVFKFIPGPGPERVLVGARLASIQLEPPGPAWVVRFQSDSGVLITNPGAARLFSPADDKELEKTLQRMTK